MIEALTDQVLSAVDQVAASYHRLVLVVAPPGREKAAVLQEVAGRLGYPYLNVNLELSRVLINLARSQRCLQANRLLGEIIGKEGGPVVFLGNLEIIFDVSLKQDPLRLLQGLSRIRTIVAAWSGAAKDDCLVYAEPGHPEYRRYPATGLVIVKPEVAA